MKQSFSLRACIKSSSLFLMRAAPSGLGLVFAKNKTTTTTTTKGRLNIKILFWNLPILFSFGQAQGIWKFPGQGLNQHHSSDNTGSLTCWATRELQEPTQFLILKKKKCLISLNVRLMMIEEMSYAKFAWAFSWKRKTWGENHDGKLSDGLSSLAAFLSRM